MENELIVASARAKALVEASNKLKEPRSDWVNTVVNLLRAMESIEGD